MHKAQDYLPLTQSKTKSYDEIIIKEADPETSEKEDNNSQFWNGCGVEWGEASVLQKTVFTGTILLCAVTKQDVP